MNLKALFKVLWQSVKDSFSGNVWKWFAGSSGSLFSLFQFGKDFLNTTLEVSIYYGLWILGGLFGIRLFLFIVRNSFKHLHDLYHESKYGEAIILLKDAFAKIHSLRKREEVDDVSFMEAMSYLCDNIQELFVGKNRCTCSVSIKVPVSGGLNEGASVMNLCRDREHSEKRDTDNYKGVDHTIIGNTAFRKVLNNVLRKSSKIFAYINNSISNTKDYDNTSKEVYPDGILPYKSEIVVPIIPAERDIHRVYDALGFVCVDCISENKFDSKYDVPLLEGVADGIYDILSTRVIKQ
jgi:hypothetical protein